MLSVSSLSSVIPTLLASVALISYMFLNHVRETFINKALHDTHELPPNLKTS